MFLHLTPRSAVMALKTVPKDFFFLKTNTPMRKLFIVLVKLLIRAVIQFYKNTQVQLFFIISHGNPNSYLFFSERQVYDSVDKTFNFVLFRKFVQGNQPQLVKNKICKMCNAVIMNSQGQKYFILNILDVWRILEFEYKVIIWVPPPIKKIRGTVCTTE